MFCPGLPCELFKLLLGILSSLCPCLWSYYPANSGRVRVCCVQNPTALILNGNQNKLEMIFFSPTHSQLIEIVSCIFELDYSTRGRIHYFRGLIHDFKMLLNHFQSLTNGPKVCFREKVS